MKNSFVVLIYCIILQFGESTAQSLDKVYVDSLLEIGNAYKRQDMFDSSLHIADIVLSISRKINYKRGESFGYVLLGTSKRYLSLPEEAAEAYWRAMDIRRSSHDSSGMASVFCNLAALEDVRKNPRQGIIYAKEAVKIWTKLQDKGNLAKAYIDIANQYESVGQIDTAVFYNEQAILLAIDTLDKAVARYGLAKRYLRKDELQKAHELFEEYLQICLSDSANFGYIDIADAYNGLGLSASDKSLAIDYFNKSAEYYRLAEDTAGLVDVYYNKGLSHASLKKYDDAIMSCDSALAFLGFDDELRELITATKNSWEGTRRTETLIAGTVILIGLLLLALSGAIFWWQRQKIKAVELKNREAENGKLVEALTNQYFLEQKQIQIDARRAENLRLENAIHQNILPLIFRLKWGLEDMAEKVKNIPGQLSIINASINDATEIYEKTRGVSKDLKKGNVDWLYALKGFLQRIEQGTSIKSKFSFHKIDISVPVEIGNCIEKSVKELVTNTLKSAQAGNLLVDISRENDKVRIVIEDDGVGFDIDKIQSGGSGLDFIREEVEHLGGIFVVNSVINKGTTAQIIIPL